VPLRALNLLFVGPKIPFPANDGGRIAIFEPMRHLAARGHRVAYLGFGLQKDADELKEKATLVWARAVLHDTRTRPLPAVMAIFSRLPYTAAKYSAAPMFAALEEVLASQSFDIVQLENSHMAHYIDTVQRHGVPAVLRLTNLEAQVAERYARTAHFPLSAYVRLQSRRMRRFEQHAIGVADLTLAITPEDARSCAAMEPRARVAIAPVGADLQRRASPEGENPGMLLYVGALDWPPNVDSLKWFRSAIWPLVRRQRPEARWFIVGRDPPSDILRWPADDPTITVTGKVPEIGPYWSQAAVVIVPLRSGGGMRVKIVEAFAMGKPVVTTSIGVEGIGASAGAHYLLADGPTDFAAQVVRLLDSPLERRRLGAAARAFVEAHLGWEQVVSGLEELYFGLLDRPTLARPG
jgi:glycosyltransferase involved in cell wall biosynthesis